jgi:glycopeptide antibiotics resistance protein
MRLAHWRPNPALALLVLWGLFIVYATTLPFEFSTSIEMPQARLHRLWLRPLSGGSWPDVYSNILLFVPWGLLLAVWQAGRGTNYVATVALALLSGAIFSGIVEFLQLFSITRFTSFVDLVTNTFGATVGSVIAWPLARWVAPVAIVRFRRIVAGRPMTLSAIATAAGFALAGVAPFHVDLTKDGMEAALGTFRPVPFGPPLAGPSSPAKPWLWGAELLAWTLAGGAFAMAAREWQRERARVYLEAVGSAVGLCVAVESLQFLIPGRDVDVTSIVLAFAGSALGATAVLRSAPATVRGWIPFAIAIWATAAALVLWSPPRFAWPEPPYLQPEHVVPFWSYFRSRTLDDLADVVAQAVLFVPLGALVAAGWWRCSLFVALLVGLCTGVIFEFGQVFLPDRTADISDAISASAGTGLGLALWRWGESVRKSSLGVIRYRIGPG